VPGRQAGVSVRDSVGTCRERLVFNLGHKIPIRRATLMDQSRISLVEVGCFRYGEKPTCVFNTAISR